MEDTGKNAPEDMMTLLHQQEEMLTGERHVQMFPSGTVELPKLIGTARYVNARGVFHYWPHKIGEDLIEYLSSQGKENAFLRLGPYSKADIAERLKSGESLLFVTEYSPMGVEVRSAAGTNVTCAAQYAYFESTKSPGNTIVVGAPPERVQRVLRKAN
jgi:hypothetical protein